MGTSAESQQTHILAAKPDGARLATESPAPVWEDISSRKRALLSASIPEEWRVPADLLPPASQDDVTSWPSASGWFTPDELSITEQTATELVVGLASGALTCEAVTRAFCKRAAAAHQLKVQVNCLSETCFERALATARSRDAHLARTGRPVGPLHGLPVSLKDNFQLAGLDSTVGFASHVGDAAAADSTLARVLEAAGAVFYVKTNVPTAMMMAETVNNVFGRTLNPRNRRTTSGGSSGGESALLLLRGSPLGVGTDIGGSLRIPAACTGLFTLRPSAGRFPVRDCRSGMPGQEGVLSVNGPMARTLPDITLYSRVVVSSRPWLLDAKCLPLPWQHPPPALPAKLRVGVMWDDTLVLPTPPVTRALHQTVARLRGAGHEVVGWRPTDMLRGLTMIGQFFVADGAAAIRQQLTQTGEPWRPEMAAYRDARPMTVLDVWRLQTERTAFQNENLDSWREAGLDALLLPTTPYVTHRHSGTRHVAYTAVFNILDVSAVSFPTRLTVDRSVDVVGQDYEPLSDTCEAINAEYDPELLDGMPISLQLVAGKLEEEKLLGMTEMVLQALAE
ncbi:acetamidase [Cordyceps fumosorosea ARSEF 2679]|uniref:Acetamidase n=1 Tax=Cordyceps fumosorosea (strain ARSEF 2679) TaxID=1081104 RepID=A0A167RMF2_CORFA|nr:acetamidase [Cordyceps fumosorosea ARSEF 2679]OAA58738.1 acetamidase [Cordyceps fumosorosea ARSEF 2679]